jgi:hypothetical protein
VTHMQIHPSTLRQILRYDAETGHLFWRERPLEMFAREKDRKRWNTRYAGKRALTTIHGGKYCRGPIFNRTYLAHRVAWALVNGEWPDQEIDHVNFDGTDNRLSNLRLATKKDNMRHRRSLPKSSSRYLGVTWHKKSKKWQASIEIDGKCKYLGLYPNEDSAAMAYDAAALMNFGAFANLNLSGATP